MGEPELRVMIWLPVVCFAALSAAADPPLRGPTRDATSPPAPAQSLAGETEAPLAEPAITIKGVESTRVVYQEHIGPYWTVGPVFMRVKEYMAEHDVQGPLFVRYLDDASAVPASRLRMEVGFIPEGKHKPEFPYRTAKYNAGLAVTMVTKASIASPIQYYRVLRDWAVTRGYRTLGPVTEIYSPLGDMKTRERSVEIQMAIQAGPKATGAKSKSAISGRPSQVADPIAERRVAESPAAGVGHVPPAHAEDPHSMAVRELVEKRRFEDIAMRIMPDAGTVPQPLRLWLGQVVHRIGAVGRGVAQVYPREGSNVRELAEAIGHRYAAVSVNFAVDPLAQPVVRVDPSADPVAAQKKAIVRDLDAVLGGIALRSIDARAALEQLTEIIQRVCDLLDSRAEAP